MEIDEDLLRDVLYNSIAEARHTLRVAPTTKATENGKTYFCSFLMNVDSKTLDLLGAIAKNKERSVPKLLRRYVKECFHACICDEETSEAEPKIAA